MKFKLSLLLGFLMVAIGLQAQVAFPPRTIVFTNFFTNGPVGTFNSSNTVIQITNGSLLVTSAPISLYRQRGFSFWSLPSPTNSTLTNICYELRFSPDGINWPTTNGQPFVLLRQPGINGGTGVQPFGTNMLVDVYDNMRYVQLYQIWVTNGVGTCGQVFWTNSTTVTNGPFLQVFP